MKIIECCPFFNENLIADIHIRESARWVDEIHIVETNRTFQYGPKDYVFDVDHPKVRYHAVDVTQKFKPSRKWLLYLDLSGRFSKKHIYRDTGWYNEMVQRNLACALADIQDDNIVVLSDIDEIIDSRLADQLLLEVQKRKIITVRLHLTMYYFNLFSRNWSGPADYSYRVFLLTGKRLREHWRMDSDRLRKQGEHGQLYSTVYCADGFAGFHHSWLGDEESVSQKLNAYAHTQFRELDNAEYIRRCIRERRSIYPEGHELCVDDTIPLLETVEALSFETPEHFIL
jgi:hypothetical protein